MLKRVAVISVALVSVAALVVLPTCLGGGLEPTGSKGAVPGDAGTRRPEPALEAIDGPMVPERQVTPMSGGGAPTTGSDGQSDSAPAPFVRRRPETAAEREAFVVGLMNERRATVLSMVDDYYKALVAGLSADERAVLDESSDSLGWHAARMEVNYQLAINDVVTDQILAGTVSDPAEGDDWDASGSLAWTCPAGRLGPEAVPFEVRFSLRVQDHPELAAAHANYASAVRDFRSSLKRR